MPAAPVVTVIALCYNHQRFLLETLESIRAQTFQDFELIVTDDASRDDSPAMIERWLAEHRPDATFIRHTRNAGLCRTLNEVLALARGTYICMIATDDAWHPERLARHVAAFAGQAESVALVYSDVAQMDEEGRPLPDNFIAQHRPGFVPPSGRLFSQLADGNFIPAMAATIRRSAIAAVGGYDERLTYEDYDMWLRLTARFDAVFCPGLVARYRIVGTSIVRTLFARPTASHSYSTALIRLRWLGTGLLSGQQRQRWAEFLFESAYGLYLLDDPRARTLLWQAFRYSLQPRAFALALSYSLGISRGRLKKLFGKDAGAEG
jgi:glycosyltransferase involved in cell wall biosynthesis